MTQTTTPDIFAATQALGPMIEAAADEIDAQRCLPDRVVEALRAAGVFRVAFPRTWGGPEMPILEQVKLVESLAYHDASTVWVAMICSDSGHYAGRVDDAVARELYPSMDLLTAGQIYPVGQAVKVDGGHRVTGRWQFGSGSLHAERIVGGCLVMVDGAPVMGDGGLPEMMVVWLPRDEVTIHDTWHTTGLTGSGSNDYSVTDAFIPDGHSFSPLQPGVRSEPLYRYRGFFFANLAAVALGCAAPHARRSPRTDGREGVDARGRRDEGRRPCPAGPGRVHRRAPGGRRLPGRDPRIDLADGGRR